MNKELVQKEISVKFVNKQSKYPKFSNGSVKLTDDTWLSVGKSVAIDSFSEGQKYNVDVEIDAKGYQTVVALRAGSQPTVSTTSTTTTGTAATRPDDAKNLRIARQGLIQALISAYGMTTPPEKLYEVIIPLANRGIEFVETGK